MNGDEGRGLKGLQSWEVGFKREGRARMPETSELELELESYIARARELES